MKERPILFSAPMVRALLNGTKTQTRRVIKPSPLSTNPPEGAYFDAYNHGPGWCWWMPKPDNRQCNGHGWWECPYGVPGDRLWVRESHCFVADGPLAVLPGIGYAADKSFAHVATLPDGATVYNAEKPEIWKFRPSIHMPRWASRITLEITEIRVQRLQDISEEDAKAEGVQKPEIGVAGALFYVWSGIDPMSAKSAYATLWSDINGAGAWDANPWVWAITFRRITP